MTNVSDPQELAREARSAARAWRQAGIARRLAVLEDAGSRLADQRHALASSLQEDRLSTSLADYFVEWIVHAADPTLLRAYARSLSRWVETPSGGELLIRRPDGVVLLVLPGNLPSIQMGSLFSILLPGNGAVVRVPEHDTGVRFLVETILRPALARAGFSPNLVSITSGKSRPILAALLPSPDIDTVVFFGNSLAGKAVAELAQQHQKKIVLELDGSDFLIVWRDADIERAVASAGRAWMGSTQPCPVPKHMLVHGAVFERFVDAFLADVPRNSRTVEADRERGMLAPLARPEAYRAALEEIRGVGELRSGGYMMSADGSPNPGGPYAAPTVVTLSADACRGRRLLCFDEEICYPLIPVVRFDGSDDAIAESMVEMVEDSPFGLRLSIWSASAQILSRFVRDVRSVGLILCNDDHARTPVYASPWGGPKRSGGPRGESHLFWEQTSHLQAIACERLTAAEIQAIFHELGCIP